MKSSRNFPGDRTACPQNWSESAPLLLRVLCVLAFGFAIALLNVPSAGATGSKDEAAPQKNSCEGLASLKLTNASVTMAKTVGAGDFTPPPAAGPTAPGAANPAQIAKTLPAFCRVAAALKPSPDSNIKIEVWMPTSHWNGRLEAVGNGGLAGSITYTYPAMMQALSAGYATTSTDTGHEGSAVDGEWALGHPEKIVDFGNRSVHVMTLSAKKIIAAYYGNPARYSYWNGCSTGGNQGMSEAQRYPTDFNGIVAGAPASNLTRLQMGGNWISQAIHKDPATFIPASKLPLINKAVLAACDTKDGVRDGVLEDPRSCHYDIAALRCKGADGPDCLTDAQVAGLKKVYAGAVNPRTGKQIFPGYMMGGELGWGTWIVGTDTPPRDAQHAIQDSFFKYLVFGNPNWDWKTFDFDKDVTYTDNKVASIVNSMNPDLKAFKAGGGKLLEYHGWSDPAISPLNSVDYYNSVQEIMGDTSSFYRLFMVPGMYHCAGGPGTSDFDKMEVIVQWVENGTAPAEIVASHRSNGSVDRTRPLCPYPTVAKYKGAGSTDVAANFECAAE